MKRTFQISILLLALFAFGGCAVTPEKAAHTTLSAIGITVDKTMSGAAEAKVAGKINDHQWAEVVTAHRRWQASYNLAVDLAAQDYSKFAPSDVIALETDLIELVNRFLNPK